MQKLVENIFMIKELYHSILSPVCSKHNITHTEIMVLLYLANHPNHTATDIVENLRFTKSAVSAAARDLQDRDLIRGTFINGNHRSIHLELCEAAEEIVKDGNDAQDMFYSVIVKDFDEDDRHKFKEIVRRITENINDYHKV